jgi:hypothetical protein
MAPFVARFGAVEQAEPCAAELTRLADPRPAALKNISGQINETASKMSRNLIEILCFFD